MAWQLHLERVLGASVTTVLRVWPEQVTLADLEENSTYLWCVLGDLKTPYEVQLTVNGQTLDRNIVGPNEINFRWEVGFNAGFADVELSGHGEPKRSARIVVDPARNKLVREDFRRMLRDILDDSLYLASTSGLQQSVGRGDRRLPIATLEYILEQASRLQRLVIELNTRHRRRITRRPTTTTIRDSRGISSLQWNASLRAGALALVETPDRLPSALRELVKRSGNVLPRRINQTRVELGSNQREHREVLGLVLLVQEILRKSVRTLSEMSAERRDEVLLSRCRAATRRLRELHLLPVFAGLDPIRARWQHSHLYERSEPYRSLYQVHRDVLSGVANIDGEFTKVALRETFRLYETWVSLRLARAAKEIDHTLDGSVFFRDAPDANGLTFSLTATAVEFAGNTLRFKPTYEEVWLNDAGIGSYSRIMIPDVVLEPARQDAGVKSIVILDAKYRVESQLNEAISSIHTYKDSIVDSPADVAGAGRRITGAGFIVVPRSPVKLRAGLDWHSEKSPVVLFRPGYQERFRIGAIVLQPGMGIAAIVATLERLLSDTLSASSHLSEQNSSPPTES